MRGSSPTQALLEGLQAGRTYAVSVAAYNDAGRSTPSQEVAHAMHGEAGRRSRGDRVGWDKH